VPRGTVGEIAVRGDNVMMGYWERPEETAKAVIDGWMHTGDGGYMDEDGFIYVVDRVKDMIISGGENVYSVEVENALAQHPAVAQCAVIGIPRRTMGRTGSCRGRHQERREGDSHRIDRIQQDADRRVQMSAQRRHQRKPAAAVRSRQGSQARTAQAVLGKPGAACELSGTPIAIAIQHDRANLRRSSRSLH
jgi:acyl-CoA synthetase (AMP-forming)/AMP-acid ligase II